MNDFVVNDSRFVDEKVLGEWLNREITIEQYMIIIEDELAVNLLGQLHHNMRDNGLRNVCNDRIDEVLG